MSWILMNANGEFIKQDGLIVRYTEEAAEQAIRLVPGLVALAVNEPDKPGKARAVAA